MDTADRLDPAAAARLIGVSPRTLRRMRARGLAPPHYRVSPGVTYYLRGEVLEWLRMRRVTPTRAGDVPEIHA